MNLYFHITIYSKQQNGIGYNIYDISYTADLYNIL